MLAEYKITLEPLTLENAEGNARAVLEKAKKQVGFIPNMYARMAHSPALLDTYLDGYAAFRSQSGFSPAEQEVIFLVISRENGCEYCVAAHSTIAGAASGVPVDVIQAIRNGSTVQDARLEALIRFTRSMVKSRGLPTRSNVEQFLSAGFEERQILEIVLAISIKTLSNYSNHLFHTPLDAGFSKWAWKD